MSRSIGFSVLLFALLCPFHLVADDRSATSELLNLECACRREGNWSVAESRSFSVWAHYQSPNPNAAADIANECERIRARILDRWGLGEAEPAWDPKCVVVIHPDRAAYHQSLGTAHRHTAGCATITVDQGVVVFRRVDLRHDLADWQINALPHELSHVVFADVVDAGSIPAWLHEGLAMTEESIELQAQRLRTLRTVSENGTLPQIEDLFDTDRVRNRSETEIDYALSLALVRRLEQIGGAELLIEFTRRAGETDPVLAFREVYAQEHEGTHAVASTLRNIANGLRGVRVDSAAAE